MTGKQLIEFGKEYLSELRNYSNELPQESSLQEDLEIAISNIESLNSALTESIQVKKKFIASGNFNLQRLDLRPEMTLHIVLFNRKFGLTLSGKDVNSQMIAILENCGISQEDILFLESSLDILKDVLRIDFTYQTDTPQRDGLDFAAEVPALYAFGYTQFQKIYIRGNKNYIDPNVYNWPLSGFCVPYGLSKDNQHEIMLNIIDKVLDFGDMADMRALNELPSAEIDIYVNKFKAKKWNRIITPTTKWWFRNGQYIVYK